MMTLDKNKSKKFAAVGGIILVGIIVITTFSPSLPQDISFTAQNTNDFFLNFGSFSIIEAEEFEIGCNLRNVVGIFDDQGSVKLVRFSETGLIIPVPLSFFIPVDKSPEFGHTNVLTTLECNPSPFSSLGYRPYIIGGQITTTTEGLNAERNTIELRSESKAFTQTIDMNGRSNVALIKYTVSDSILKTKLKDNADYTAVIRIHTTGFIDFAETLDCNDHPVDCIKVWRVQISEADAFTSFGLTVTDSNEEPDARQSITINSPHDNCTINCQINIDSDLDIVKYDIKIIDFNGITDLPTVNIFWYDDPNRNVRNTGYSEEEFRTLQENPDGTATASSSFHIPNSKYGLWCFELEENITNNRASVSKCVNAVDKIKTIVEVT